MLKCMDGAGLHSDNRDKRGPLSRGPTTSSQVLISTLGSRNMEMELSRVRKVYPKGFRKE